MRVGVAGLVLVLAAVACRPAPVDTGDGTAVAEAVPQRARPAMGPGVPRAGAAPVAGPGLGSGKPVTFAFAGDVNFEAHPGALLAEDPSTVLADVAPILEADVTMVNLETSVSERGTPEVKAYTFRAAPTAFLALRAAGVDVVTLANNHGLDYGQDALLDTLDHAADPASGLPLVGAGRTPEEAYEPFRVTLRGQRIAIFGASRVVDGPLEGSWTVSEGHPGLAVAEDPRHLLDAVAAERPHADTVIVYLHWGQERNPCPIADQPEVADALIDAGADVIIGSHAHVPLAGGMYRGAYVDFGLGNFLFGSAASDTSDSGVLHLTLTGRRVDEAEWVPAHLSSGVPEPLEGREAADAVRAWTQLRGCTDLAAGVERGGGGSGRG